ncbi:sodium- and chloride-dependent GABA transporter 1-like [Schistocerca gregaria]|uniref:sodium- and chloride-dependent GABA transporter 1-like n=1 Tax=Schistocerca gregaria TaxID=7010 RepID=UPI00211DD573|nr:sodium- and chloride-dependent GABA transporter 1-like [Schistocerca gregaria]
MSARNGPGAVAERQSPGADSRGPSPVASMGKKEKRTLKLKPEPAEFVEERGSWASPTEFLMSCLTYAVGLGNVWRFPYLVYRNGGGAFLIPYIVMLMVMGVPIFFMEMVLGQYSQQGATVVFARMAPIFQGVGFSALIIVLVINIIYMVVVSWTLFYMFASFSSVLGWARCDYDFNSDYCYSEWENQRCMDLGVPDAPMTFHNRTCVPVDTLCSEHFMAMKDAHTCSNGTADVPLRSLVKRVLSSEEYYNDFAMGIKGATWERWGDAHWSLMGCLALAWLIAFLCVFKSVKTTGKIVYFTAIFPYFVLLALLIRAATLEGALDGVLFYVTPQWAALGDAAVWGDAASQTFYALSIGCASLITLSSYSYFGNNCHRDAIVVSATNALTGVLAGFVVFSVLGFMAHEMGEPVSEVVASGPGLAFVAYPEAVLRMPLPQLWSALFFFMLFVLGIGCQFGGVEAVTCAIVDRWPQLRRYQTFVTGGVCLAHFLLSVPMCFGGGIYLFTLIEWNVVTWSVLLVGLGEVIVVAWVYGGNRFLDNIAEMGMKLCKITRCYWWFAWTIMAPICVVAVFGFTMYNYEAPYYGDYVFPDWVNVMGILIGTSAIVPMPVFAVYRVTLSKERGAALFRPTLRWGPGGKLLPTPSSTSTTPPPGAGADAASAPDACSQHSGSASSYSAYENYAFNKEP